MQASFRPLENSLHLTRMRQDNSRNQNRKNMSRVIKKISIRVKILFTNTLAFPSYDNMFVLIRTIYENILIRNII